MLIFYLVEILVFNLKNRLLLLLGIIILSIFMIACESEKKTSQTAASISVTDMAEKTMPTLTGKVKEVLGGGGFTYILVQSGDQEYWVAIPETKVMVSEDVTVNNGRLMKDFASKALNRTFAELIISPGLAGKKPKANRLMERIEKAAGKNGYTVAELFAKAAGLTGQKVQVRGEVIKVSKNIMGKNWLHIQDGTGNPKNNNHDLTVTSSELPQIGKVVTMEGVLATNKNFGGGYQYEVIVEQGKSVN